MKRADFRELPEKTMKDLAARYPKEEHLIEEIALSPGLLLFFSEFIEIFIFFIDNSVYLGYIE